MKNCIFKERSQMKVLEDIKSHETLLNQRFMAFLLIIVYTFPSKVRPSNILVVFGTKLHD